MLLIAGVGLLNMSYIYYNPNPKGKRVGDCVIRAISKNLRQPWIVTFVSLMRKAISMYDMPSSNSYRGSEKVIIIQNGSDCLKMR